MKTDCYKFRDQLRLRYIPVRRVRALFSPRLLGLLARISRTRPSGVYLAGGTVRDLLLDRKPKDVDLTVSCHARAWGRELARLSGGALVELGREEDAARVVCNEECVDFSSFRAGAVNIEQELTKRDLTVNALAVCIDSLLRENSDGQDRLTVIDPLDGVRDLAEKRIRLCSRKSIPDDPLRMLRVFRFSAVFGFTVDPDTLFEIRLQRQLIARVSVERIAAELHAIMTSDSAHGALTLMAETGLLFEILPELEAGRGMDQPASHHLDVYEHLMETLLQMEAIEKDPEAYFPGYGQLMEDWLNRGNNRGLLKWAALLHDVGKPVTYGINEDKGGRITFYNHDLKGADLFTGIARRLRWSGGDMKTVAALIAAHMRPFFLANDARADKLTLKGCLRLVRKVGELLPGLFMLAMADALAGKGEGSPEDIEREVAGLFARLHQVEREHVAPVQRAKPLLTGRDLINDLRLEPGPLFRTILEQVREARMEGRIATRSEALALAGEIARKRT